MDWFSCSSHQHGFLLDGGLYGDVGRDARGAALLAELLIGNTYIRGPVKKLAVPLAKGIRPRSQGTQDPSRRTRTGYVANGV